MALEAAGLVNVEGIDEDDDPKATRYYRAHEDIKGVYETVAPFHHPPCYRGGRPTDSHTLEHLLVESAA